MTTNSYNLTHPLPFFHHVATGRVLYIATGPCPFVFSISLKDVGRHVSSWANFCDDVAERLNDDETLADALDDTWVLSPEQDVALEDDEPADVVRPQGAP